MPGRHGGARLIDRGTKMRYEKQSMVVRTDSYSAMFTLSIINDPKLFRSITVFFEDGVFYRHGQHHTDRVCDVIADLSADIATWRLPKDVHWAVVRDFAQWVMSR